MHQNAIENAPGCERRYQEKAMPRPLSLVFPKCLALLTFGYLYGIETAQNVISHRAAWRTLQYQKV
jgi:hypothetical protein